jgi:hypothetical protein
LQNIKSLFLKSKIYNNLNFKNFKSLNKRVKQNCLEQCFSSNFINNSKFFQLLFYQALLVARRAGSKIGIAAILTGSEGMEGLAFGLLKQTKA